MIEPQVKAEAQADVSPDSAKPVSTQAAKAQGVKGRLLAPGASLLHWELCACTRWFTWFGITTSKGFKFVVVSNWPCDCVRGKAVQMGLECVCVCVVFHRMTLADIISDAPIPLVFFENEEEYEYLHFNTYDLQILKTILIVLSSLVP